MMQSNKLLAEVGVAEQERWAYERRTERMDWASIAALAAQPTSQGGMGVRYSEATWKRRVRDYLEYAIETDAETREQHRAMELAGMDQRQRRAAAMLDRIDAEATLVTAARLYGSPMSLDEILREAPECVVLREEKVILAAIQTMDRIAAERRKLLGTDAPVETKVTISTATDEALASLAEQLGVTSLPEGATP